MKDKQICMRCGSLVPQDKRFCHVCGGEMPAAKQQNRLVDKPREPDAELMLAAGRAMDTGAWEEADALFGKRLVQDPGCADAWLGRALVRGKSKTLAELVRKLMDTFEESEVELREIPEERAVVERCIQQYASEEGMTPEQIRQNLSFDRSYPSRVTGAMSILKKMEDIWSGDSYLGKAAKYAKGDMVRQMYAAKSDMLSWASQCVIDAQRADEESKESKQKAYAAFLVAEEQRLRQYRPERSQPKEKPEEPVTSSGKNGGRTVKIVFLLLLLVVLLSLLLPRCADLPALGGSGGMTAAGSEAELRLTIRRMPQKLMYYVGQEPDLSGLELELVRADGTTEAVNSGFEVQPASLDRAGTQTVTVTYAGMSVEFQVEVETAEVTGISLLSAPTRTEYFVGNSLETEGLRLQVYYADGTQKEVSSGFTCQPQSLTTAGTTKVTVTYGDHSAEFSVNVKTPQITSVSVESQANKLSYYTGDSLDTAGLKLRVYYEDGTSQVVSGGFTCQPMELSTAGEQKITVSYGGKTVQYSVQVQQLTLSSLSIQSMPYKTSYYVGDYLNTNGLSLLATYSNGTQKTVTSGYSTSVSQFVSSETDTVSITYGGRSVQIPVSVKMGKISLAESSKSISIDCWSLHVDSAKREPYWLIDIPSYTVENPNAEVTVKVVNLDYSDGAYYRDGYAAIRQPGRILISVIAKCGEEHYAVTCTITVTMYKQSNSLNYVQSGPGLSYTKIGEIDDFYVVMTEVGWNWNAQDSNGQYWVYGKISYNGREGWVVIR